MLDQICIDYEGYVAAVEWHISSSYPLYNAEGRSKMRTYPPPYNGGYATPWAWIDGRNCSYVYSAWPGYVSSRILDPSDVRLWMSGTYDPGTRSGTVQAVFYNQGLATINATCEMVITEDSLNYTGPNGDPWHNHVCRDYLPDHLGTPISIPGGGYDTVVQSFTLQPGWVERMCKIVVYAQDLSFHPDSGYGAFQAGSANVLEFVGLQEPSVPALFYNNVAAQVSPSPCRKTAQFRFAARPGRPYHLNLYRLDGSLLEEFSGLSDAGITTVTWQRGVGLARGVYAYRVEVAGAVATGKFIVAD